MRAACLCSLTFLFAPCPESTDCQGGTDEQPARIVQDRPSTGRCVEIPEGFMVPYTVMVPGTEVRFAMEPMPAGHLTLKTPGSDEVIRIEFEPFWMARHEVTWAEYQLYMRLSELFRHAENDEQLDSVADQPVDAVTAPTRIYDLAGRFEYTFTPLQPAVTMSQYAARQYTKWLSLTLGQTYRLPTEAEWEYGCRAGSREPWSFGSDVAAAAAKVVCAESSEDAGPTIVGMHQSNAWGLHDMHGNVAEWTLDGFHPDGLQRLPAGNHRWLDAWFRPVDFQRHVVRGGSWLSPVEACRSDSRIGSSNEWWEFDADLPVSPWWLAWSDGTSIGFRIMSPLKPEPAELLQRYWNADVPQLQQEVLDRVREGRGSVGRVDPGDPLPDPANDEITDDVELWMQRLLDE